jgi:FMN reductase
VSRAPFVLGFGGTRRPGSSSERILRAVVGRVGELGAETEILTAGEIDLPMYDHGVDGGPPAKRFLELVRRADGIVVASPGYHGSVSGLVKNAIDWVEELRDDERPYFTHRPVGLVACAYGWQATTSTLMSLRSIAHALRGWPTPLGLSVNSKAELFEDDGTLTPGPTADQLAIMSQQVYDGARAAARLAATTRG